jgi:hypothetical protein
VAIAAHPSRIIADDQWTSGRRVEACLASFENKRRRNETVMAGELKSLCRSCRILLAEEEIALEFLYLLGSPSHLLVREAVSLLIFAVFL